ncbi:putative mitochondrial protein [Tanacetum coccineum]|uniref:Mitochondrial protein n=1 Tax=Tanacetum coccineum TaxID=301880 RepID=A0ABQ4XPF1_9ASTR
MEGKSLGAKLFSMAVCVYSSFGVQVEYMSIGTISDYTNVHPYLSLLLHEYDEVFIVPQSLPPHRKHNHGIPLLDNTSPINIRLYKHPPTQKDAIEAMVKELLDSGIIRASYNPFYSPIVIVKKKDGSWRMYVDYKAFNNKTVKDKFPILVIEELIDELFGAQVFTKLDLRSGYHQIRMCEDDIHKALMNEVFAPYLRKFALVFFDDILVYNKNMIEHAQHLAQVLSTMQFHQWPVLVNIKKLRGILGLTGYYRRFVKNCAAISNSLTKFLKNNSFEWSNSAQIAFDELKAAMINTLVLALLNFQEEFTIKRDTSNEGIGAVLQQKGHPISFLSRSFAPKHKGLSIYEKELWVIVYALEKWKVTCLTDISRLRLIISVSNI